MNNNSLITNVLPLNGINSITLKNIFYIIFGTLLLTVSSKIQVPFWPVPMTMQTFVVLVLSMAYGWKLSALTLIFYLFEGAIGLPVFAKGGGLTYLVGPTAGYLYGMTVAAAVIGYFADKGYGKTILKTLIPLLIGTIIIFLFGIFYLVSITGMSYYKAIQVGLLPFIPSELFKIALALFLIPTIWKIIKK